MGSALSVLLSEKVKPSDGSQCLLFFPSPIGRRWREAPDEGSRNSCVSAGPDPHPPRCARRPLPEGEVKVRSRFATQQCFDAFAAVDRIVVLETQLGHAAHAHDLRQLATEFLGHFVQRLYACLLYTSPSPRDS